MPPERKRLLGLLALLGVTIVGAAVYEMLPEQTAAGQARVQARTGRRGTTAMTVTAPDVHLQALKEERPQPGDQPARDLFRFKPKAPPPAPPRPAARTLPPPLASVAVAPPTVQPIALRFIGLVEAPEQARKIAILTDGRGIYQGREGDIIEGRYRVLRIGVESVEMAYLDGTGRQTIRLSGS